VLTSLIDVIFLLVIFFMVTSQIVPFSMISLGAAARDDGVPVPPVAVESEGVAPVTIRILAGRVRIGPEAVAIADLRHAFDDLRTRGVTTLVLIPTSSATVQDMVAVLETAKVASIENVTLIRRPGIEP
jgi:biopolymer transport protein ExbD